MVDEWLYTYSFITTTIGGETSTFYNYPGLTLSEDLEALVMDEPLKINLELGPVTARTRTRKESLQLIWIGLKSLILGCRYAE
jgi:hypothetical protein